MLGAGVAGVADGVSVGSGLFLLVRVLWRSVWVFVAVQVWVSQLLVLGFGVVGWGLLRVGARNSWLRAWWLALMAFVRQPCWRPW